MQVTDNTSLTSIPRLIDEDDMQLAEHTPLPESDSDADDDEQLI